MLTRTQRQRAREVLDSRLAALKPITQYAPPRLGWVRAIRDALGMSAADLAARMGVTGASVRSLEANELSGGVRLASLRRAAAAMDCTLVYAFVPNTTLEDTVMSEARCILAAETGRVRQTMALEDQESELSPGAREERLREIAGSSRLWRKESNQG